MAKKKPKIEAQKIEKDVTPATPAAALPPPSSLSLEERIARRQRGERQPAEDAAPEPEATAGEPASRAQNAPALVNKGLRCASCGCGHLPVLYTRPQQRGKIARVRRCRNCGKRTTTYESPAGCL